MEQNIEYALEIMGMGMLSIFTVIVVLLLIIVLLAKVTGGKKKVNEE
ncbi:hypothetical protein H0486_14210 [Lachnospiraceae bacterium MD1]|jgi:hypothetical protein|uniref:Oxaloacetate decarboxylase n=1 Tax=Variimorphobacter saccharofermentans TaxID=2755051 RepID=A0A839K330_9FIRM|nr:hypothetical protein [Variimorphobacter saccharofermentans]MBB2184030.1 hypothetical protein [Variimorphobacter saccharofermentans]